MESILSAVLTAAAVLIAAALVRLAFFPAPPVPVGGGPVAVGEDRPTYIDKWEELADDGVRFGDTASPIQLIMFSDLECPFCASFHEEVFKDIWNDRSDDIGFTFVHFPLERHRFARPAAHAAECAGEQDQFLPMIDRIYAGQDSLGLKAWWDFAREAGVADSVQFDGCLGGDPPRRISVGVDWAEELQVRGTPTIIVSGWRLPTPPGVVELRGIMRSVGSGGPPVPVDADR